LRINQSNKNDFAKERRPSVEELPCLKSKISSYKAAAEENGKPLSSDQKIKPILVKKPEHERSRSPRKKTPKLVSDHYLSPSQAPFQIYAQSATDVSATEDELEAEKNRKISLPAKLPANLNPGPGFLKVPTRAQVENRMAGLMKSKSFASPGQFECSLDDDSITNKQKTIMTFFSNDTKPTKSIMKRPQRRNSLTSITDEVIGDEDLADIDEEFENLLTQTFEKESKRSAASSGMLLTANGGKLMGGEGGGGISSRLHGGNNNNNTSGGKKFSSSSSNSVKHTALQKSKSFSASCEPSSSHFSSDNTQQVMNKKMSEGFDPFAALPTSSGVRQPAVRSPPPAYNSPSPTPSEYDTADPADDSYD